MSDIKDRVLAGASDAVDPAEVIDNASDAVKDRWIAILIQLTESHRFNTFLEDNFVIQDRIDHEKETFETLVIEKPISVGPPLSSAQLTEMQTLLKISDCKQPAKVFESLLKILGQDAPTIIQATGNENFADLKLKLE